MESVEAENALALWEVEAVDTVTAWALWEEVVELEVKGEEEGRSEELLLGLEDQASKQPWLIQVEALGQVAVEEEGVVC